MYGIGVDRRQTRLNWSDLNEIALFSPFTIGQETGIVLFLSLLLRQVVINGQHDYDI